MNGKFCIAVDDVRECSYADILIRDPRRALEVFEAHKGRVHELYLDFDLGEDCPNGWSVLIHLLEYQTCPPVVQFITANPVGRKRMEGLLKDAHYSQHGQYWISDEVGRNMEKCRSEKALDLCSKYDRTETCIWLHAIEMGGSK